MDLGERLAELTDEELDIRAYANAHRESINLIQK